MALAVRLRGQDFLYYPPGGQSAEGSHEPEGSPDAISIAENMKHEYSIVLFDGECNFCNATVQKLIRLDRKSRLKFASLQSAAGQRILREHGLPPEGVNSMLLLDNGILHQRSDAVLRLLRRIGGPVSVVSFLQMIPRPLRDAAYNFIARHRLKIAGRKKECAIPTPEIRARFLTEAGD
jgi:predicted DCC family thiol-disulfide oxidoreductase YuxK